MDQIPDEILLKILLFISYKNQSYNVSVCSKWYRLLIPNNNYDREQERFLAACKYIHRNGKYFSETFQLYELYIEIMNPFYRPLFLCNQPFRIGFIGMIQSHFGRTCLLNSVLVDVSEKLDSFENILGWYRDPSPSIEDIENETFVKLFSG